MNQKHRIPINSITVDLTPLESIAKYFFNCFGTRHFLGDTVFDAINSGGSTVRFADLLSACGYKNDPQAFFAEVVEKIFHQTQRPVRVNRVPIPVLFLTCLLETIKPGRGLHRITRPDQLETLGFVIKKEENEPLQKVMDSYPVRLSDHVVRQCLASGNVSRQYLPFIEELDRRGDPITFEGHLQQGMLERMYENRVIFLLDMRCPVYCRFCFRKHKELRKAKAPGTQEIAAAIEYVKTDPAVKEVLITGGEPLLNRPGLDAVLAGLTAVPHVGVIRIATRSVAYFPDLFLNNNKALIRHLIKENRRLAEVHKQIEIGVHFVHPDDVSLQSLEIISDFVTNGIRVYVQTPFLNRINSNGKDLVRLFTLLRNAGVQIYTVFAPCSPIHGTQPFWAPISDAVEAMRYLRTHISDRAVPKLCTATPLGKIEWGSSGWAVEKESEFTWIRTPYTSEYYRQFVKSAADMPAFRRNPEGTLDARFRVEMGDDNLVRGNRPPKAPPADKAPSGKFPDKTAIMDALTVPSSLFPTIAPVPGSGISLVHPCVLQMDMGSVETAVPYLGQHPCVTDVIVLLKDDALAHPVRIAEMAAAIKSTGTVTCLRLCCMGFNRHPEKYPPLFSSALVKLITFHPAHPFRVEIETGFLEPEEVTGSHQLTVRDLSSLGIVVYANVPLIAAVNDNPDTVVRMANRLRWAGIEFHRIYVDGLALQDRFNRGRQVNPNRLIDIASAVRRSCSGRQIPQYVRQTPNGDQYMDMTQSFMPGDSKRGLR